MYKTTDAAADASQIACKCGGDHPRTNTRSCPVIRLNRAIREFLDIQDVFESGKDGVMAHCLRAQVQFGYRLMMGSFEFWEAASEEHPEWNLAEEIARLRRYADQVAVGCADDKTTLDPCHPPASVAEAVVGDEEPNLRQAKRMVFSFYQTCNGIISEFVVRRAESLSYRPDEKGYLPKIDNGFKEAFEDIILLPKTDNATIQDLTRRLYDIWKESRRLLCDYRPPMRSIIP